MSMTPRQFEARYEPVWVELERGLDALDKGKAGKKPRKLKAGQFPTDAAPVAGAARVAQLYRQCCEHLALARERAYPVHLVARLETLTARAHQRIYRRHDFGLGALRDLILYDAPAAVRALRWHLLVVALVFVLPIAGGGRRHLARPALRADRGRREAGAQVRRHVRPGGRRTPGAHVGRRLADVRLLHHAQRRHLVPVLRRRPDAGHRQPGDGGLQRPAARRRRRLPGHARRQRALLLVRGHALGVRAHRHRAVRRRRPQAGPCRARARAPHAHAGADARGARDLAGGVLLLRDADHRRRDRGVLVVGRLDRARREVRRRRLLLGAGLRVPGPAGPRPRSAAGERGRVAR